MTELPSGWAEVRTDEAGTLDLGRQRSPKYHSGPNMKPYLRVANVFEDRIDTSDVKTMHFEPEAFERSKLHVGDVLLNEGQSPEWLGRPAIYRGDPPDVAFTNSLIRFKPNAAVTSEWALTVFRHHMHSGRFARESRITTNIAHLSASRLAAVEFRVPPLAEQERIVAAIEEAFSKLDAGEAGLRTVRQLLKRMREAVLAAAVTGRLVPQEQRDTPATTLLRDIGISYRDDAALSQSPLGWASAELGALVEPGRRIAYGVLQPGGDVEDGVPLVRVMDLVDGAVAIDQLKRISPAITSKFPRTTLAGGEVLLSVVGTIGRVAVAPGCLRGANVARAVAVLPLRSDVVLPDWIGYALRHEPWRQALEHTAHEVARKTLNLEDVRQFPLPIPPIAEQARIVAEIARQFSVLDASASAVAAALIRSAALRRSVLKAAFEGRLVPQDPADEPASLLLDRIRAERAASDGSGGGRRRKKVEAS